LPIRLAFSASDGTNLVGTYYPPANCSAPLALLFHQNGRSKEIWVDLALWLQNRSGETSAAPVGFLSSPNRQYNWFPPMPQGLSIAVLAVDFRNHGESGGSGGFDPAGFLQDAQAALAMGRSLPEVDPEQVITIGTSIGADAAVDVCISLDGSQAAAQQQDQGCRGALSFSPGNFLGVAFQEAVGALGQPPHQAHVRCLAAEGDGSAPDLCRTDFGDFFSSTIYPGSDHGIDLITPGRDPEVGTVILDFLNESLGLE
jgi:pimeloyl-ACP methyl ester carboxylesterase